MKDQNSGFSLIELLVAIVFLIVFAGIGISIFSAAIGGQDRAEQSLSDYSQRAGLQPIGYVERDTDGDGYISCDAKDDSGAIVLLQCSGSPFNSGCKVNRVNQINNGVNW